MRGGLPGHCHLGVREIIRILVLSDFLRPWLGELRSGKSPPGLIWNGIRNAQKIYYLILAGCLLVGFISGACGFPAGSRLDGPAGG